MATATDIHFSQTMRGMPNFSQIDLHSSRGLTVYQICPIRTMLILNNSFGPSTHISHSRNKLSAHQIKETQGYMGTRIQHKAKKQATTIETIRIASHPMLPKPTIAIHRLMTKKIRHQITRMSISNMRTTTMTPSTAMQIPIRTFGPIRLLPKAIMSLKSLITLSKHTL